MIKMEDFSDDVFTRSTHERLSRLTHDLGPPLDIHTAASLGDNSLVLQTGREKRHLLDRPNSAGWTPLMYACYYGHGAVVHSLLVSGVDPAAVNARGQTPLALTASRGHDDVLLTLLNRRVDIECRDARDWTPLHYATDAGHRSTVQLLLSEGANPNALDRQRGETPLLLAAAAGDELLVFALIRNGANPQLRRPTGATAREVAEAAGHERVSQLLAEYDASEPATPTPALSGGGGGAPAPSVFGDWQPGSGGGKSGGNAASSTAAAHQPADLPTLLATIGLSKYLPVLEKQEVDLPVFLVMTDDDLKEAGITLLGPRRKMTSAISRWHRNAPLTPGPERAYADGVARASELAQRRLQQAAERESDCSLNQERQLRAVTESLLLEERRRLQQLVDSCRLQQQLARALPLALVRLGAAGATSVPPEPAAAAEAELAQLTRRLEAAAEPAELLDSCGRLAQLQRALTDQLLSRLQGMSGRMERATSTG